MTRALSVSMTWGRGRAGDTRGFLLIAPKAIPGLLIAQVGCYLVVPPCSGYKAALWRGVGGFWFSLPCFLGFVVVVRLAVYPRACLSESLRNRDKISGMGSTAAAALRTRPAKSKAPR